MAEAYTKLMAAGAGRSSASTPSWPATPSPMTITPSWPVSCLSWPSACTSAPAQKSSSSIFGWRRHCLPPRPAQQRHCRHRRGRAQKFEEILVPAGMGDVAIFTEMGRFMLAPLRRTCHHRAAPEAPFTKEYIGVDACAANLMRPAMYGSYHHITVLGKEDPPATTSTTSPAVCVRTMTSSPLTVCCRKIDIGDIVYIHDTGAHGFSMGYNYNGKLRSAGGPAEGGRLPPAHPPCRDAGGLLCNV